MKFTDEQKNALNAKGRVLVSAAAGSGKTAVLVERAVRLMTEGDNPVDADRLLIVTFTSAAAAEMKSRIAAKLRERALEIGNTDLLRRQQYLLSIAKICTIDSFCISLVRENFYRLGIAPDFKIADNSVLSALKNEAMTNTIDHLFSQGGTDFELLCETLGEERADYALKSAVESVYNETCNHPFPNDYLDNLVEMYSNFDYKNSAWTQTVLQNVEYELNYAQHMMQVCEKMLDVDSELDNKYRDNVLEYKAIVTTTLNACKNGDWDSVLRFLTNFSVDRFSPYKGDFKDEAEFIKNTAKDVRDLFKSIPKTMLMNINDICEDCKKLASVVRALADAVRYFTNEYKRLKKERNCVEFIDAEYMALELLTENHAPSETAKSLSDFYYEVMVDEYQDVNDLQNTIFELLSDNGNKIFMVGDVKQSIYRFRNANPAIFLKNRNELPEYREGQKNGKVIMSGNFRSAPEICGFVNDVFRRLMTVETAGMNYGKEDELRAMGDFADDVEDRVIYEILDCSNLPKKYNKAQVEAQRIVELVNNTVCESPFIKTETGLRKAEYGDIAILLRDNKYVREIKNALDKAGIPNSCKTGGNLLDCREISLLLSILETINNPYRDISTVAVMMSPLFNFTADELANLRIDSKYKSVFSALSVNSKDNAKYKAFCDKINRYREWSKTMSVGDLLRKICDDCSFFNLSLTFKSGENSRNNILTFIGIADNFDSGPDSDLIRFLRYVKRAAQSDRAFNVKSSVNSVNAVQIVTMHSSKGLQYPVCILAGLSIKMNKSDQASGLLLDSEMGFGMSVCDPKARIKYKTVPQQAIKLKKAKSQISEELCVLYVAMTRAIEKLYMISTFDKMPESTQVLSQDYSYSVRHSRSFTDFLTLISDLNSVKRVVLDGKLPENKANSNITAAKPNEDDVLKIKTILEYEYPYEVLNTISSKQTASGLAHGQNVSNFIHSKPMFKREDKMSAAQKGTACHKFMEFCDILNAGADLQGEIARLESVGVLTQLQSSAIDLSKIKPFFESTLYREINKSADSIHREQKFIASLPASAIYDDVSELLKDEEIIIQGAADLIVIKDKTLYIIDYKTDRVKDSSALIDKYKLQLDIYAKAFSQIFECDKVETVIYSFYLGKEFFLNA